MNGVSGDDMEKGEKESGKWKAKDDNSIGMKGGDFRSRLKNSNSMNSLNKIDESGGKMMRKWSSFFSISNAKKLEREGRRVEDEREGVQEEDEHNFEDDADQSNDGGPHNFASFLQTSTYTPTPHPPFVYPTEVIRGAQDSGRFAITGDGQLA